MNAASDGIRVDRVRNILVMMERTSHGMCGATVRSWAAQIREAIGDVEPDGLPEKTNVHEMRDDA